MENLIKFFKIKRRAIALLASMHFYGNPSKELKIVGVTGTNGKTTTATLLYKVACELGYKAGLISTVENRILDEVIPATHTTPDPINLNKLLKKMTEKKVEYVFMEVSSHAMDQNRVAGIDFTGGIFTNLTHDHLDYHKSVENYFNAKKKFFKMLPSSAFALSNSDDEHGALMLENIKAQKYAYGFKISDFGRPQAQYFQSKITKLDFSGITLEITLGGLTAKLVKSKLLGKFNAYNLLSVWSACKLLGFDMERVNKILENIEPPVGRFEHYIASSGVIVIVDYAHTPDALENVLSTARSIISSYSAEAGLPQNMQIKIIAVFGCGGDRDNMKRRVMGKLGAQLSNIAIFTSDNPRSEDPMKIINEMKTDLSTDELKKIKVFVDRGEAIAESIKLAQSGDIILCAGKGHETYQEIRGIKHHFNDMEEYKKLLK
ncbi:MAG: UDP-N-acetylmuramoyl-L-alanyl-D-glutamate--2,6-diaminopimelate ligase [bacterium]|nr:UDP-N-acetylmuramoyl-L-alanyl-D-glutamate--2,6-diaminopimelate ligase [bacterium]